MVLFQLLALAALVISVFSPSCASNSQCGREGTFCSPGGRDGQILPNRCAFCSTAATAVLPDNSSAADDAESFCQDRTHWKLEYCSYGTPWATPTCPHPACDACSKNEPDGWGVKQSHWYKYSKSRPATYRPNSTWGVTDQEKTFLDNLDAMQMSDMGTLIMAAAVVSFSISKEIRDIRLCKLTILARSPGSKYALTPYARDVTSNAARTTHGTTNVERARALLWDVKGIEIKFEEPYRRRRRLRGQWSGCCQAFCCALCRRERVRELLAEGTSALHAEGREQPPEVTKNVYLKQDDQTESNLHFESAEGTTLIYDGHRWSIYAPPSDGHRKPRWNPSRGSLASVV